MALREPKRVMTVQRTLAESYGYRRRWRLLDIFFEIPLTFLRVSSLLLQAGG
jgi:hypothetical protein